jgi:hypothetical protein
MSRLFAGNSQRRFAAIIFLLLGTMLNRAQSSERVDFNFEIRPLLSDRCFKCHGPDEKSRKAKLRLDLADEAYALRDAKSGTRAIVSGKPAESELVRRVTSTDPDEQMPPPDSNLKLNAAEISLMQRWIEQGAEYKSHWSFNSIGKIKPPPVKSDWAVNPIDQFVLAKLQREKLTPSPGANKETLIRRVSFDLIGLPPSVEEVDLFLKDTSSSAYEKVVDRLLASPAYGERMANDWLDVARYADTYGYQSDVERDMSPWRDWVIRAFNENLPYDKFITWQIAGDLLPNATDEQILATAFNRLHRQTNEGGSIEDEFRTEYVADRVHTMGTAFLGLTLECCRCHDHKYDPITQKNYYQLFAFFNNIDESGLYSHFTRATPSPSMLLYQGDAKQKHAQLKQQIGAKEKELSQIAAKANKSFDDWSKTGEKDFVPQPIAAFDFENISEGKTTSRIGTNHVRLVENPLHVEGKTGKALKFDGENSITCKDIGNFKRTDSFSFSFWLKPTERQDRAVVLHHSRAWSDSGSRGCELVLEKGRPSLALIHFWPGNAICIRASDELPMNQWTHLTLTYDGSSRAAGLKIFRDDDLMPTEIIRDNLSKDILHRAQWGDADAGNIELILGARFRDSGFKNGLIDEFQVFDKCLTPSEIKALADRVTQSKREDLLAFYLSNHHHEFQTALADLKKLRDAENDFVNDIPEIMVMKEMPQRRQTFLLKRGAYDAPGEAVEPETPEKIFPFSSDLPRNRLGFAQWLVHKRNPLTARVAVNRIWAIHFGRGLVATPEDFGSQGQLPTHPELLDWLANKFIESDWNVKSLHKLIVMSATYRQSSAAPSSLVAADPDNRFLARGPKHRLPAEQIRDEALAVSGLLVEKIGGPSVKPYQPAGLWEESGTGKSYVQDHGEHLYRRSLYTFWRRTAPPPSMLTFDATSREVCTARRQTTATPLQSLTLLNDPQFIEAARVLAEKILRDANENLDVAIEAAFQSVLCRKPKNREREISQQLYHEQLQIFSKDPAAAEKYLAIGEHPRDKAFASEKLAAAAVLISTLMNHDEFVMKR